MWTLSLYNLACNQIVWSWKMDSKFARRPYGNITVVSWCSTYKRGRTTAIFLDCEKEKIVNLHCTKDSKFAHGPHLWSKHLL
jgi:hypothetical protein